MVIELALTTLARCSVKSPEAWSVLSVNILIACRELLAAIYRWATMLWAPSSITRSPASRAPGIAPMTVLLTTLWRYLWPVYATCSLKKTHGKVELERGGCLLVYVSSSINLYFTLFILFPCARTDNDLFTFVAFSIHVLPVLRNSVLGQEQGYK